MPRAICRCGENLNIPNDGTRRTVCPRCGARVKLRIPISDAAAAGSSDGFIRFFCPCGRRLKVNALDPPTHGKCPDCGRVVPVPITTHAIGNPESSTEELSTADREMLDRWAHDQTSRRGAPPDSGATSTPLLQSPIASASGLERAEVGLRVCPRCGKPVHLGADVCRHCGTAVPRR
jgi:hypothetical protein